MRYFLFFIVISSIVSCGKNQFEITTCKDGYVFNNDKCIDINECLNNTHNCGEGFSCFNREGSFECNDINECSNKTADCSENAICLNLDGYYNCVCKKGFEGDGINCVDIDECENETHNCLTGYKCNNTEGSFKCLDINECLNGTHNCNINANCSNTNGSFTCICKTGFSGDGITCNDINECDGSYCSINAFCTNTIGSYSCSCKEGFEGNGVICNKIFCGNNILTSDEECDGTAIGIKTCSMFGYSGGDLTCNNNCEYSTKECRKTQQFGTSKEDSANTITIDKDGNLYIAGYTNEKLDENECVMKYMQNTCSQDIFLTKLNSLGIKQWTVQIGSIFEENIYSVITDTIGNIFIVGSTYGRLGEENYIMGGEIAFLIKYNSNGEKQWVKEWNFSPDCDFSLSIPTSVAINTNNEIIISGITSCEYASNSELFLIKTDSNGDVIWNNKIQSEYSSITSKSVFVKGNNIYVTGFIRGNLNNIVNNGKTDIFLMKYDNNGNNIWSKLFGTIELEFASSIYVNNNYIYILGGTTGNFNETNLGDYDILLIKLDINGEKIWSKQEGTNNKDVANSLDFDNSGNIYITGYTKGSLDGNTNKGNEDIFISKFTQSGQKVWTKQFGTSLYDSGNAIAIGNDNSIYITGTTSGQLDWNFGFGQNDIFFTTIENQ